MPEPLAPPSDEPLAADVDGEHERIGVALQAVADELNARAAAAGGDAQQVLEASALMAQDPAILDDVRARLQGGANAERATWDAYAGFRDLLTSMGGYMAERATDLDDVETRGKLLGMAAADRIPIAGYHMPFPAVGFVEPMPAGGFRYSAVSYQLAL